MNLGLRLSSGVLILIAYLSGCASVETKPPPDDLLIESVGTAEELCELVSTYVSSIEPIEKAYCGEHVRMVAMPWVTEKGFVGFCYGTWQPKYKQRKWVQIKDNPLRVSMTVRHMHRKFVGWESVFLLTPVIAACGDYLLNGEA